MTIIDFKKKKIKLLTQTKNRNHMKIPESPIFVTKSLKVKMKSLNR